MKYYLILFLSLLFSSQFIETGVEDKSMVYIYHSGKAMINENILIEGDRIKGFTLKKIDANQVILRRGKYRVNLKLEK